MSLAAAVPPDRDEYEILGYVVTRKDPDTLDVAVAEPGVMTDLEDARTLLADVRRNAEDAGDRAEHGVGLVIDAGVR